MKVKILLTAITALFLTACYASGNERLQHDKRFSIFQPKGTNPNGGLEVLTRKTELKAGENAIIVMRGRPGTTYTIKASYKAGGRELDASDYRTASPDGIITWTWLVGSDTTPGVYPLEISGGGEYYKSSYSVIK